MGNRATKGLNRLKTRQKAFDEMPGSGVGPKATDKDISGLDPGNRHRHRPGSVKK